MSGLLKGLERDLNNLGKKADAAILSGIKVVDNVYNESRTSPVLNCFRHGNVVQLVSVSSGRTLQICVNPGGSLEVDGMGPEGPQPLHTHWYVTNHGKNIVSLQNQMNFLAITNGTTHITSHPSPELIGANSKFRLIQSTNYIQLESLQEQGKYVAILATGQLKAALAARPGRETQFAARVIYSPPAPSAPGASSHPGQPRAVAVATVVQPRQGVAYATVHPS